MGNSVSSKTVMKSSGDFASTYETLHLDVRGSLHKNFIGEIEPGPGKYWQLVGS
jgi:hypothetical protein